MKTMIFFLLLCVTFFAQAMETNVSVALDKKSATDLQLLPNDVPKLKILRQSVSESFTILSFCDELKIRFYEYAADDETLDKGVRNVHALAATCKEFLKFSYDAGANGRIIKVWEKKVPNQIVTLLTVRMHPRWNLFSIAERLHTKGALFWLSKHPQWQPFIIDLKKVALSEKNQWFAEQLKKFIVKVDGIQQNEIIQN